MCDKYINSLVKNMMPIARVFIIFSYTISHFFFSIIMKVFITLIQVVAIISALAQSQITVPILAP